MGTFLAALLEKTGIRRFFSGVSVELPAYFLPNFQVVEIQALKRGAKTIFQSPQLTPPERRTRWL
jgi:hypothetical protein